MIAAAAAPISCSRHHRMLRLLPSPFCGTTSSSGHLPPSSFGYSLPRFACAGRRTTTAAASYPGRSPRRTAMATTSTETMDESPAAAADQPSPPPSPRSQIAKRLENFKTTIFTQMSSLALKHGAINLGQGFPNFDGPDFVKEAAIQAIREGKNQYARGYGVPSLNAAIAARFQKDTGLTVDPETEVTVTSGCTEAIAATMLGLVNLGDEIIVFAPFYDSYQATLSMAGARVRSITLRPPDFAVPIAELRAAFSEKTRAILLNTPHNPTGKMLTMAELQEIAALCVEYDSLAFCDEVYDKLAFEAEHISLASLPGMFERTVTMNSLGKTFSLTGWKIGWAIAPATLTWGVRQAHAFLTFATSTPMQHAAAAALSTPDGYYEELRRDYAVKKEILVEGLRAAGFVVYPSSGTYFVVADHTPFGFDSDVAFCEYLIQEVGVVAIPTSVFYLDPEEGKSMVRFTFCKDEGTLREAVKRMEKLRR